IELVAVVQQDEVVTGCERHASGAHDGLYELVVGDRELVIESVAWRKLVRRNQIADEAHQSGDDRPIPPVGGQREHAQSRPRPPRPEKPSTHCPKGQPPFRRTGSRPHSPTPLPCDRRFPPPRRFASCAFHQEGLCWTTWVSIPISSDRNAVRKTHFGLEDP